MQKRTLLFLIPTLVASLSLFACKQDNEPKIEIDKTEIKQTYLDLMKNNTKKYSAIPNEGVVNLLIIPVWFTDSSTFITNSTNKDNVKSDIEDAFFGDAADTGWYSVSSFYSTESFGKVTLTGTVTDWYEISQDHNYYSTDDVYSTRTTNLTIAASEWYFAENPNVDRTTYDLDGDGYLDGVILIYAAPDYQAQGLTRSNNLWAYTSWVCNNPKVEEPVANQFSWMSYDFMYGANASGRAGTNYHGGDTSHLVLDTHIYIHETGHLFGLYDYYDYDTHYDSEQHMRLSYVYAGGFSMQDYNVGGHDAYSVMALGWADPFIPTTSGEITLKSFQKSHQLVLLTPEWNDYDSPFDEYVLLELYTNEVLNQNDSAYQYRGTYPKGPTVAGIRVWHVDSRLVSTRGKVTPNAKGDKVTIGTNNNEKSGKSDELSNANLLQLIRNNTNESKNTYSGLSNNNLFKAGSSFSVKKFSKQFNNTEYLDNFKTLDWSFSVKSIFVDEDALITATISLNKTASN